MQRRRIRTTSKGHLQARHSVADTVIATTRRALRKARQMSQSTRSQVSYAGVRVMTMSGLFGTTSITPAMGPRRKCPRPYHADKRTYAKRHRHRHRRVGRMYVHHQNPQCMDYRTVRPAIARTLCRPWDAPRECVPIAKGCISDRAASQNFKFKRGFVQIPGCLYQDYAHFLLLFRIIPIPPPLHLISGLIRNLPRRDILSRTVTTGLYALISSSLCRHCARGRFACVCICAIF